jgi:hypothetical protein
MRNHEQTRGAYKRSDVFHALTVSLLCQNQQDALYWAFELVCSGLPKETLAYLVKCFYYFYCTQNPHMEQRILTLTKDVKNESIEQTVAQLIKLFVKLPFNLDVYLLHSWWWMTPLEKEDDNRENNIFSTTHRMFRKYSAKKACVKLAHYIQTQRSAVKGKKIYVTQVPKDQLLQFTDQTLVKAKSMIVCDYWSQDSFETTDEKNKNKKEALKLMDLVHELTNKLIGSILTKENVMNKNDLLDMQFVTQDTEAHYWTEPMTRKERVLAEMMACFVEYNKRDLI